MFMYAPCRLNQQTCYTRNSMYPEPSEVKYWVKREDSVAVPSGLQVIIKFTMWFTGNYKIYYLFHR